MVMYAILTVHLLFPNVCFQVIISVNCWKSSAVIIVAQICVYGGQD